MSTLRTGIIKWFNETSGYGFIEQLDSPDIFAHRREIVGAGVESLVEGQTVEFDVVCGDKGLQAVNIIVIRKSLDESEP